MGAILGILVGGVAAFMMAPNLVSILSAKASATAQRQQAEATRRLEAIRKAKGEE